MAKPIMIRPTDEAYDRLHAAWVAADPFRRLPFSTWCCRTLVNLFSAAKAPKPKSFRERYGPSRGTPKRRKVA